jgi:hypothetical protein
MPVRSAISRVVVALYPRVANASKAARSIRRAASGSTPAHSSGEVLDVDEVGLIGQAAAAGWRSACSVNQVARRRDGAAVSRHATSTRSPTPGELLPLLVKTGKLRAVITVDL